MKTQTRVVPAPRPLAGRVRQLRADADELVELALRLRDLAASLRATRVAPPWLDKALAVQIMRCMSASSQLKLAARRLEEHSLTLRHEVH
ncbi:hypothetical protein ACIBG8_12875 [Nonomuraea sp. NPDC050556]|uniref:hypothetical protein n=1 Tax=Nonomuraea sp. NPDC050556 TaxID=3364369 RepID=UPI00379589B2